LERRNGLGTQSLVRGLVAIASLSLLPAVSSAGLRVYEKDDVLLEFGMRLQPRAEYARFPVGTTTDGQRDFLIRRARLKANGKMQGVTFGFEWKIDNTDAITGATTTSSPVAGVENAWLQYPLGKTVSVRAGLYDQPFSRDRLTSDSRQLAVDRGAVSDVLALVGLADNAVGLHVLGNVKGGRGQYALGLFDNVTIGGRLQDVPMVVGRVDLNFGSTKDLYQDAHFGSDKWYSIGVNGSYHGSLENAAGADDGTNSAAGVDGMVDVPLGGGRVFVRGEMNAVKREIPGTTTENNVTLRMIEGGFLVFKEHLQPFVRFDQVRGDTPLGGVARDITYVGANLYQKGHSLKLQGDVRFQSGTEDALDGARVQAQIDF
jgi:hypothetical protein